MRTTPKLVRVKARTVFTRVFDGGQVIHGDPDHRDRDGREPWASHENALKLHNEGVARAPASVLGDDDDDDDDDLRSPIVVRGSSSMLGTDPVIHKPEHAKVEGNSGAKPDPVVEATIVGLNAKPADEQKETPAKTTPPAEADAAPTSGGRRPAPARTPTRTARGK